MTMQIHMDWVEDQICYKNKKFNMDWLRGMMHGLVGKYRRMLVKEVMKMNEIEEKKKKKLMEKFLIKLKKK